MFFKNFNKSIKVNGTSIIQSGNKTIINGHTIEGNFKSVSVVNGKIYLDGKEYKPTNEDGTEREIEVVQLIINGNVNTVDSTVDVSVNGEVGTVRAGRDVQIEGNVNSVSAGRDIDVDGDIKGNAKAGRDISY